MRVLNRLSLLVFCCLLWSVGAGCPASVTTLGNEPEPEGTAEPSAVGPVDGGEPAVTPEPGASPEPAASPEATPAVEPSVGPENEPSPTPEPAPQENTPLLCTDGLDNDNDNARDCADLDCANVGPCGLPEDSAQTCTDGVDNDGDSYFDCVDFDCDQVLICTLPENSAGACSDGVDNDGDGYTDCIDFGCGEQSVCQPNEDDLSTCTDTVDNDEDGATDCEDEACAAFSVCQTNEDDEETCRDGVDNDGDGDRDCADAACVGLPICNRDEMRVVAFNVQDVGGPATASYAALLRMLGRLNGDLVCMSEVDAEEGASLASLAADAGYPFVAQGNVSTAMAGGLTNACISRFPIVALESRSSDDISSDGDANETGRDILLVRVEIGPGNRGATSLVVHYKAGFSNADFFRRHIETLRTIQVLEDARARFSGDAFLVLGDFNEDIDDEPNTEFATFPQGMPLSYRLGDDLAFPFVYGPLSAMVQAGLTAADATWEDSTIEDATRYASNRRIDYIFYDGLTLLGDEVYDPCRDNGVDDPPVGNFLQKSDAPIACADGELASDHRPVVADFSLSAN